MRILATVLILSAASFSCASQAGRDPSAVGKGKPTTLTVIATTDLHGAAEPKVNTSADGKKVSIGGPAVFASYLKILRDKSGPTIYVDAGDLFQGTMASNLYEGAPVIRLYNYYGLSAAALGNHEFDYGPAGDKAVPRSPSDDPRGALKERIREAKFPFLAANVRDESGKVPSWIKASTIVTVEGIKVGIVGAASPGTPGSTNALNLVGLRFLDSAPSVKAEAERLRREEKVDVVVLTIHEGGGCDDNNLDKQDDLSSCKITDVLDVAKALPEGLVDVIVAGHTHQGLAKRVGRTAILQPYSNGKYIGWLTVPLADKTQKPAVAGLAPICEEVLVSGTEKTCEPYRVKKMKGTIAPATFLGENVIPDTAATDLIRDELTDVKARKERKLGVNVLDEFTRDYNNESPMGDLFADVAREAIPNVDLGLQNAGGVRENLQVGALTYGAVFGVLPFDNQLAIMRIPGAKVTELVKIGIFGGQGVYNWSSNLSAKVEGCDLKELLIDGRPVDEKKIYSIATSDFLAGGGSGVSRAKIPAEMVEIFWDRPYILRDLSAEVLTRWRRDLRSADFFDRKNPRLKISGKCEKQ